MENQEKNKQNSVSFGNLKKLSGIISGTEINSLVSNISKSKMALDTFCKNLKEHENLLKKNAVNNAVTPTQTKSEITSETKNTQATTESKSQIEKTPRPNKTLEKSSNQNVKFSKVNQKEFKPRDGKPQVEKDGIRS